MPRPAAEGHHAHYRRWSAADLRRLRDLWGSHSLTEIARVLGRSERTIYWYAGNKLGLDRGVPQGCEYLTAAAKRTGYSTAQIRVICRAEGVKLRATLSRPTESRTGRRFHYVDSFDLDEAVTAWLTRSTVHEIAIANGTTGDTLRTWLTAAGFKPPRRGKWRISIADAEQVIREHRALETLREAALRNGVTRQTLAGWMRAAGHRPTRPRWFLRREDVDRVVEAKRAVRDARTRAWRNAA